MQFFASSQEARPGRATTLLPLCNHLLREVVAGAKLAAARVVAAATSATTYIFNGKGITVVLLDKYTGKGEGRVFNKKWVGSGGSRPAKGPWH